MHMKNWREIMREEQERKTNAVPKIDLALLKDRCIAEYENFRLFKDMDFASYLIGVNRDVWKGLGVVRIDDKTKLTSIYCDKRAYSVSLEKDQYSEYMGVMASRSAWLEAEINHEEPVLMGEEIDRDGDIRSVRTHVQEWKKTSSGTSLEINLSVYFGKMQRTGDDYWAHEDHCKLDVESCALGVIDNDDSRNAWDLAYEGWDDLGGAKSYKGIRKPWMPNYGMQYQCGDFSRGGLYAPNIYYVFPKTEHDKSKVEEFLTRALAKSCLQREKGGSLPSQLQKHADEETRRQKEYYREKGPYWLEKSTSFSYDLKDIDTTGPYGAGGTGIGQGGY